MRAEEQRFAAAWLPQVLQYCPVLTRANQHLTLVWRFSIALKFLAKLRRAWMKRWLILVTGLCFILIQTAPVCLAQSFDVIQVADGVYAGIGSSRI